MVPRQRQPTSSKGGGVTAKNERKAREKNCCEKNEKRKQPERATRSVNKVGEGVRKRDEGGKEEIQQVFVQSRVSRFFFFPYSLTFSRLKKKSLELVGSRRTFQFGEKGFRVPITVV